jgi:hypothetical protein
MQRSTADRLRAVAGTAARRPAFGRFPSQGSAEVPRRQKLKVFRTPIGFHDAYVAAPSQKAALEAWGADSNLFAAKAAEEVTDEQLKAAPLARPGEVVKVLRGTRSEQLASLTAEPEPRKSGKARAPRPSRAELSAAEDRIAALEEEQQAALRELEEEARALAERRRATERRFQARMKELVRDRDKARDRHERAMERWRG